MTTGDGWGTGFRDKQLAAALVAIPGMEGQCGGGEGVGMRRRKTTEHQPPLAAPSGQRNGRIATIAILATFATIAPLNVNAIAGRGSLLTGVDQFTVRCTGSARHRGSG